MLLCFLFSFNVQSHPHSWIDLKTVVQGDEHQITGFNMSWTFDAMTSAYMLDGEDLSKAHKEKALQDMADGIMENLYVEHYFTYFYEDGKPVKFTDGNGGRITQDKLKLTLHFFLPLSKPKPINKIPLTLRVYESSYYVQMSWLKKEDVTLSPQLAKHCSKQLIEPQPTEEQSIYASSKPKEAAADNQLGGLFSQTVTINCSVEG